jgi:hypothetical protein
LRFEDFRFNLGAAGCWWHTLYPFYVRKSIYGI